MYLEHFKLRRYPFENVPDPAFFQATGQYKRIIASLMNSVQVGRGLIVISGPIGSGKTTLSQKLVNTLSLDTQLIWLAEPPKDAMELFSFVARELGVEENGSSSFILKRIRERLLQFNEQGRTCLLIIDESHHMNDDVFEAVRVLTNLEQWTFKLMQILLLGQPELMALLNQQKLEPLRQRIAVLHKLDRLRPGEAREYIATRLQTAGAHTEVFTKAAMALAAHVSGGIPRLINNICQMALQHTFERDGDVVRVEDVKAASVELGYGNLAQEYLAWFKERANELRSQRLKALQAQPSAQVGQVLQRTAQAGAGAAVATPQADADSAGQDRTVVEPEDAFAMNDLPEEDAVETPFDMQLRGDNGASRSRGRRHVYVLAASVLVFAAGLVYHLYRTGALDIW